MRIYSTDEALGKTIIEALPQGFKPFASALPAPVEEAVKQLGIRRVKSSDDWYCRALSNLFAPHGIALNPVHREARFFHSHSNTGLASVATLNALKYKGQILGLRGGRGWEEILANYRHKKARKRMGYEGQLECFWGPVMNFPPWSEKEVPTGGPDTVAKIMAHFNAQALEMSTPSSTSTHSRVRF